MSSDDSPPDLFLEVLLQMSSAPCRSACWDVETEVCVLQAPHLMNLVFACVSDRLKGGATISLDSCHSSLLALEARF